MNEREHIALTRNCEAILVPNGTPVQLKMGTHVMLQQALGGSFTVITDRGNMVRIAGKDGDALGKEVVDPLEQGKNGRPVEDLAWDQLKTVYDPEIPIDIVELGLIYFCKAYKLEDGEHKIKVRMTLTAPGCGMGDVLQADVLDKLRAIPGVREVDVEFVFDPPWGREMMSDAARLQLGLM